MDGLKLQQRMNKGFGKAGKRAGLLHDQYRFTEPFTPIQENNRVEAQIPCLYAASTTFKAPVNYKDPVRLLYADGNLLQQFDLLVGPYGTFFVASMQPIVAMQAVRCNNTVQISRASWAPGGIVEVDDPIAIDLPCFTQARNDNVKDPLGAGTSNIAGIPLDQFVCFLPLGPGVVLQGDNVLDQTGQSFQVDQVDNTEIGLVVLLRQTSVSPGDNA